MSLTPSITVTPTISNTATPSITPTLSITSTPSISLSQTPPATYDATVRECGTTTTYGFRFSTTSAPLIGNAIEVSGNAFVEGKKWEIVNFTATVIDYNVTLLSVSANCPSPSPSVTPSITPSVSVSSTPSNSITPTPSITPSQTPPATYDVTVRECGTVTTYGFRFSTTSAPLIGNAITVSGNAFVEGKQWEIVNFTAATIDYNVTLNSVSANCPSPSPSPTTSITPSLSVTSTPSNSVTATPSITPSQTPPATYDVTVRECGTTTTYGFRFSTTSSPAPGNAITVSGNAFVEGKQWEIVNFTATVIDYNVTLVSVSANCPSPTPSPTTSITPSLSVSSTPSNSITPTPSITPSQTPPATFDATVRECGTTTTYGFRFSTTSAPAPGNAITVTGNVFVEGKQWEIVNFTAATIDYNVTLVSVSANCPSPTPSPTTSITPTISITGTPSTSATPSISITPSQTPPATYDINVRECGTTTTYGFRLSTTSTIAPGNAIVVSGNAFVQGKQWEIVDFAATTIDYNVTLLSVSANCPTPSPSITPSISTSITPSISVTPSISLTTSPSVSVSITPSPAPATTYSLTVRECGAVTTYGFSVTTYSSILPGNVITVSGNAFVQNKQWEIVNFAATTIDYTVTLLTVSAGCPSASPSVTPTISTSTTPTLSITPSITPSPSNFVRQVQVSNPPGDNNEYALCSINSGLTRYIGINESISNGLTIYSDRNLSVRFLDTDPLASGYRIVLIDGSQKYLIDFDSAGDVDTVTLCGSQVSPTPSITPSLSISTTPSVTPSTSDSANVQSLAWDATSPDSACTNYSEGERFNYNFFGTGPSETNDLISSDVTLVQSSFGNMPSSGTFYLSDGTYYRQFTTSDGVNAYPTGTNYGICGVTPTPTVTTTPSKSPGLSPTPTSTITPTLSTVACYNYTLTNLDEVPEGNPDVRFAYKPCGSCNAPFNQKIDVDPETSIVVCACEGSVSYLSGGGGSSSGTISQGGPCASPTPSKSVTSSVTATPSTSVSTTPSISITPTISVTPSISISTTPSTSITPTISVSPTITPSISTSATPSVSITPTISVTPSISTSTTPSISITPTISVTPSISTSTTPSTSITPTVSVTSTVTPSISTSTTPSTSITPTVSISSTPSVSVSPLVCYNYNLFNDTGTGASYQYGLCSGGTSGGFLVAGAFTQVCAKAGTVTFNGSVTQGSDCTVLPSRTPSPTITPTVSQTPSISVTVTPTLSITPTGTPSLSITPSISNTATPSPSTSPTCLVQLLYRSNNETDLCNDIYTISSMGTSRTSGLQVGDTVQFGNCSSNFTGYVKVDASSATYYQVDNGVVTFEKSCLAPSPSVSISPSITPSITPTPSPSVLDAGTEYKYIFRYASGSSTAACENPEHVIWVADGPPTNEYFGSANLMWHGTNWCDDGISTGSNWAFDILDEDNAGNQVTYGTPENLDLFEIYKNDTLYVSVESLDTGTITWKEYNYNSTFGVLETFNTCSACN